MTQDEPTGQGKPIFSSVDVWHWCHPGIRRAPSSSGPIKLVRRDFHEAFDVAVVSVVKGYDDIVASVSSEVKGYSKLSKIPLKT